jgi:FlaA1/EpsC-like NDP-sugar epimerase
MALPVSQILGCMRILDLRHPVTRIGPAKTWPALAMQAARRSLYTQAVTASPANAIDWQAFLARPQLPAPSAKALEHLRDAHILVTGAGGSIGSAFTMRLAALAPEQLRVLDASEQALHRLQVALSEASLLSNATLILGNCNDSMLLDELLEPSQLIFHAAAYKHVPLLEQHPFEAIANNALATLTLAESAKRAGVARIVLLSTDKAAAPASILGATKRIAERIVLAHNGIALRLANVLGTEGSVSETFARQVASGAPITITSKDAERYFLARAEAVDLLLASAIAAPAGSLLAPQLPGQHRITDLASFLSEELSPGQPPRIVFTGHRPGDKQREVFCSNDEQPYPSGIDGLFQIAPTPSEDAPSQLALDSLRQAVLNRDLSLALDCVASLVPGYLPSDTILAQLGPSEVRR